MTDPLPARGFGPGLPAAGAAVTVRCTGDRLGIEGWPGITGLRRSQARLRRQGDGLMLEWRSSGEACALLFERGSAIAVWLPLEDRAGDGRTGRWILVALAAGILLPLLVIGGLFIFRDDILDAVVARIPVAQEQRLAEELWKAQRAGIKIIADGTAQAFIGQLGGRLAAARPTPYRYRFVLADDASVNAFAMPAGIVVVHCGLLAATERPEELAGVLAHEIEHVEQRHSLRGMVRGIGAAALWSLVGGDVLGAAAADAAGRLMGLQFSREQEMAADEGGFERLVAAGIDPSGMASFFARLAKDESARPGLPAFLSTHPASAERAARLAERNRGRPAAAPLIVDWPAIRTCGR
jgi:Zn-dependent protease with chaperone function